MRLGEPAFITFSSLRIYNGGAKVMYFWKFYKQDDNDFRKSFPLCMRQKIVDYKSKLITSSFLSSVWRQVAKAHLHEIGRSIVFYRKMSIAEFFIAFKGVIKTILTTLIFNKKFKFHGSGCDFRNRPSKECYVFRVPFPPIVVKFTNFLIHNVTEFFCCFFKPLLLKKLTSQIYGQPRSKDSTNDNTRNITHYHLQNYY